MKRSRILSALLVLALVVGLFAGCGQTNVDEPKAPVQNNEPQQDVSTGDVVVDEKPYELTMMANFGEIGAAGQKWLDQVEEKLNIKINWILPEASSYVDTIQLTLLDKELPDVIFIQSVDATYVTEACEQGVFIDISEYLPKYENITKHTSENAWRWLSRAEGQINAVPKHSINRLDGFSLNKQWLENLNIDYVEGEFLTLDEFYDIMYQFTYGDPDGNGIDDTYGLMAFSGASGLAGDTIQRLMDVFDCPENKFGDYDGVPKIMQYSKEDDNWKQYLTFVNKLWEDGLFDPDAFSISSTVANERYAAGMYGCKGDFPGNMDTTVTEDSPYSYVYCPGVILDENDTYSSPRTGSGVNGAWFITADCENPDRVLEFFDYILSDENWVNLGARSLEGVLFTLDANGNYDWSLKDSLPAEETKTNPIDAICRRAFDAEFYVNKTLPAERRQEIAELIDLSVSLSRDILSYKTPAASTDPVFVEYQAYMNTQIGKIIAGEEPVEHWDEVLDGWYEAGGDQWIAEILAEIKAEHGYK